MNTGNYKSNLSIEEKILVSTVRLAETFKRIHTAVFRRYGLSFQQYNVLRVLEACKNGQNKIGNVSRIMLVPGANITGIAQRLAKNGFINKKSDPKDERVTILEITAKGRKTLIKIEKDEWLMKMLRGLSRPEKNELLEKIIRITKDCTTMDLPAGDLKTTP